MNLISLFLKTLNYYHTKLIILKRILTDSPDEMVVTWSTPNLTLESVVEYGEDLFNLDHAGTGTTLKFVDQGSKHSTQYIHRVHLTNLKPNTTYCE